MGEDIFDTGVGTNYLFGWLMVIWWGGGGPRSHVLTTICACLQWCVLCWIITKKLNKNYNKKNFTIILITVATLFTQTKRKKNNIQISTQIHPKINNEFDLFHWLWFNENLWTVASVKLNKLLLGMYEIQ